MIEERRRRKDEEETINVGKRNEKCYIHGRKWNIK
jgi:hypothetical protein